MPNVTAKKMNDGDALFDKLDYIMDRAKWQRRCVQLRFSDPKHAFHMQTTAYDVRALQVALSMLAQHFCTVKFDVPPAEMEEIVENIIDEYDNEIRKYRLPEKG